MRIAAGKFRGRNLAAARGAATRPTGARVREALFDILVHGGGPPLEDARVLDVFAGAGALGFEALSRGAAFATFMERSMAACDVIAANAASLEMEENMRIVRTDASLPPQAGPDDASSLVFLDPPYRRNLEQSALRALAMKNWVAPGAMLVVEHDKEDVITVPAGFAEMDRRVYGTTGLLFLRYEA